MWNPYPLPASSPPEADFRSGYETVGYLLFLVSFLRILLGWQVYLPISHNFNHLRALVEIVRTPVVHHRLESGFASATLSRWLGGMTFSLSFVLDHANAVGVCEVALQSPPAAMRRGVQRFPGDGSSVDLATKIWMPLHCKVSGTVHSTIFHQLRSGSLEMTFAHQVPPNED